MEMDALVGKTIGELREAGYDDSESGTEGDDIVYVMRNGLFEYSCIVDADFDAYEKAQEEWPDGGNDFVIKSVSFHGITSEAIFKRYHTDGSVEEDPDPFEGYAELMTDVQQMIDSVQNGEEVNIDEYFSGLKDKYDAVQSYIDALNAGDVSAMLSTFAIETYVDNMDAAEAIDRIRSINASAYYTVPVVGPFDHDVVPSSFRSHLIANVSIFPL
jgi:hypothetical protein